MAATILVVEDDKDLQHLCAIVLRRSGHDVVGVESAEDAVAHLESADLVLLDIRLPGRSGLDLLRDERPTAPVLVMSAHADEETAAKAIQLGASGFIKKPFNPLELADRVNEHLGNGRLDA